MTNFEENPTKIGGSILDSILPGEGKIKIRLILKNAIEKIISSLTNVFYLPYSPLNVINLGLLNNIRIFHHNKNKTLYNYKI